MRCSSAEIVKEISSSVIRSDRNIEQKFRKIL